MAGLRRGTWRSRCAQRGNETVDLLNSKLVAEVRFKIACLTDEDFKFISRLLAQGMMGLPPQAAYG